MIELKEHPFPKYFDSYQSFWKFLNRKGGSINRYIKGKNKTQDNLPISSQTKGFSHKDHPNLKFDVDYMSDLECKQLKIIRENKRGSPLKLTKVMKFVEYKDKSIQKEYISISDAARKLQTSSGQIVSAYRMGRWLALKNKIRVRLERIEQSNIIMIMKDGTIIKEKWFTTTEEEKKMLRNIFPEKKIIPPRYSDFGRFEDVCKRIKFGSTISRKTEKSVYFRMYGSSGKCIQTHTLLYPLYYHKTPYEKKNGQRLTVSHEKRQYIDMGDGNIYKANFKSNIGENLQTPKEQNAQTQKDKQLPKQIFKWVDGYKLIEQ